MSEIAVDMLDLALAYARRGWRVFPLNGKVPAIAGPGGCLDATTDLEAVFELWRARPSANIGIATGEASGVLAIDLDGPDARRAWLSLVGRHEPIETATSRTGRADGGLHVLFAWPAGEHVPNRSQSEWSARVLGHRKIEVIGEGRYIVAPGSLHATGARYAWELGSGDRELAPLPAWLLALLREEIVDRQERPTWKPRTENDSNRARSYCTGALKFAHDEVAQLPKGERNARLVLEAFKLGGLIPTGFLEVHEVREALRSACAHWAAGDRDVRKDLGTIERGLYAGMSSPRSIPEPRARAQAPMTIDTRTPDEVVVLEAEKPPWRTPKERALTLGSTGERMPTGLSVVDEWSRGGLLPRRLVAIGGAPGAGKTTLALQLAHRYHDQGHPVAVLAADEDADGLLMRWGQQCGLTREDLEQGNEGARKVLANYVDSDRLMIIDADDEKATIEDAAKWLVTLAEKLGRTGVLVVDSIQTARSEHSDDLQVRERVDQVVKVLKAMRRLGLLVVATSEVSRSFYGKSTERTEPLAAFKESGGIEYGLDVAIVLDSVKGEVGQVDVFVPKSRLGRSDRHTVACRLSMDFARAKFAEIRRPEAESDETDAVDQEDVDRVAHEILRALLSARGEVTTRRDLERCVSRGQRVTSRAVSMLIREGRITGGRGKPYQASRNAVDSESFR